MAARLIEYPAVFIAGLALLACSPGGPDAPSQTGAESAGAAVDEEAANAALGAFGLAEQGRVTWERMSRDGAAFTFENVTVTDPDGALTAARMVLTGPRITEEGPVFERFELTEAEIDQRAGLRAGFARLSIVDAGPELAEAVAAALQGRDAALEGADPATGRFGEISIDALTVVGVDEDGRPIELDVRSAEARGSDGETIEALRLEQLVFATQDEQGAPVTVELGALSAQGIAAQLAGLADSETAPAAPLAGALTPNSQYDSFSIRDLAVRASGVMVELPGLAGTVEEAGENRLISRTVMERLSITADPEAGSQGAQFATALDQLGYETLNFSLENAVVYDLEADRVQTIEDNYLRLEDGFTLRFEQVARGAGAYAERYTAWLQDGGATGETPPAEVFEPLMIERMVIALEDQSLLDRSLGAMAEMQGVTPEQLRVQAGAYVALGAAFAGELVPPQLLSQLQSALTGFIGQGGTLTVTMAPPEPVSMGVLVENGGATDAEALGLSVTHDAP